METIAICCLTLLILGMGALANDARPSCVEAPVVLRDDRSRDDA
jgi:hypothetical protein